MSETKGLVYSIQRYCIHDGKGIRTTVFLKGCDLFCPWCSNPESQSPDREIGFMRSKCSGCGRCLTACPIGAVTAPGTIDRTTCDLCGRCAYYCMDEAYKLYGETYTVERLLAEVDKDAAFYRTSGGGVTVSGGEPTAQLPFLAAFLGACKERGYHTSMESHASYPWSTMERLLGLVDDFLLDIKHMDPDKNRRVTGADSALVLDNIRRLALEHNQPVYLRVPVIPGFNDDGDHMRSLARYAAGINTKGNVKMIHLLPYHNLGKSKYETLGREYPMPANTQPPPPKQMEQLEQIFQTAGLPVQQGG